MGENTLLVLKLKLISILWRVKVKRDGRRPFLPYQSKGDMFLETENTNFRIGPLMGYSKVSLEGL